MSYQPKSNAETALLHMLAAHQMSVEDGCTKEDNLAATCTVACIVAAKACEMTLQDLQEVVAASWRNVESVYQKYMTKPPIDRSRLS